MEGDHASRGGPAQRPAIGHHPWHPRHAAAGQRQPGEDPEVSGGRVFKLLAQGESGSAIHFRKK